jgi:hypothetical protein
MDEQRVLDFLRQNWAFIALIACALWAIEAKIAGNSTFEILIGPVMVLVGTAVIILVDRWARRG